MRDYNVTPQLPPNGFTVAELFCGGGLMAVGIQAAGYYIKFANDFDSKPVQAYKHNIGDHVLLGDITSEEVQDQIPSADIIAGGPPCQDFSVAGTGAGVEGERGKLVWTYLTIIRSKKPKAFVFENVKGLLTKKHRPTFDALLEQFDRIGYTVSWQLVNAWDFGVAQKRERVFIVGIRKDLDFMFEFPESAPEEYQTQTLRDAIGDLPEPHGIPLSEKASAYMERDPRHYQKHRPAEYDRPSPTLPAVLHKGMPYGLFIPDNHLGALFDNVNYEWTYEKANRQASWDKPGATVGGHARNEGVHPDGNPKPRRFTVRECLRIQSVPDWYAFPEGISLSAQYQIVGNGVASRVAYVIGVALAKQLHIALSDKHSKAV